MMNDFAIPESLLKRTERKKKQQSEQIRNRRVLVKKDKIGQEENELDVRTFRNCILSGTTSSFLRAVVLLAETNTHYFLSVYEPNEEPLTKGEVAAVLMHHQKEPLQFKEQQTIREIKMNQVRKHIEEDIKIFHLYNLTLANVHHDYVRYFGESNSLEEVVTFHLLHNGIGALDEVIRRM